MDLYAFYRGCHPTTPRMVRRTAWPPARPAATTPRSPRPSSPASGSTSSTPAAPARRGYDILVEVEVEELVAPSERPRRRRAGSAPGPWAPSPPSRPPPPRRRRLAAGRRRRSGSRIVDRPRRPRRPHRRGSDRRRAAGPGAPRRGQRRPAAHRPGRPADRALRSIAAFQSGAPLVAPAPGPGQPRPPCCWRSWWSPAGCWSPSAAPSGCGAGRRRLL